MAAMAIMGILAAIAIPNFLRFQERARQARMTTAGAAHPDAPGLVQAGLTQQQLETLQWIELVRRQSESSQQGAAPEEQPQREQPQQTEGTR
jgi:type II secretory pathway pseudopilin PulG